MSGKGEGVLITSGVAGFDAMIKDGGLLKENSLLVSGGCGTGKTLFCLQNIYAGLECGEKALYLSFEETEERLLKHMRSFGWDPDKYVRSDKLVISKLPAYKVSRAVEGMLAMSRGDLDLDVSKVFGTELEELKPDRIVVDSLSALSAAFSGRPEDYRLYLEEVFEYLKSIHTTPYFISETEQTLGRYSRAGVEEFLADVVVVLYNSFGDKGQRQRELEILKMRGTSHLRKLVPFEITDRGIKVNIEKTIR